MSRTGRGTLLSDAALSLAATAVAAVVALVSLPYIVTSLGIRAYGLFTLLALTTSYLGVLDFGFSWTTSRYVAESLGREDEGGLRGTLRMSFLLYVVVGVVGAAVLYIAASLLVTDVFNAGSGLHDAGIRATRWFAVGFPFAMLQTYGVSVLRGARRFDLTAFVQIATTVGTTAATVVVLAAGVGLEGVAVAIAASQFAGAALALGSARWVIPHALSLGRVSGDVARSVMRFSLSVGASNLGAQLLYLPNRLAVGVLLPVKSVALFSVPFSLAQRLQTVTSAVATAGLPTMTHAAARLEPARFAALFWRLVGMTAALVLPLAALAIIWAPTLLKVWIASEFGSSAAVLRITVVAVLANSVTALLAVACDSAGVPSIPAFATLCAGALNVGLAFSFTELFGIAGAATALLIAFLFSIAIIGRLWSRRSLSPLGRPTLAGIRIRLLSVLLVVWLAVAAAARTLIDTRLELVVATTIFVVAAYSAIAACTGHRGRLLSLGRRVRRTT